MLVLGFVGCGASSAEEDEAERVRAAEFLLEPVVDLVLNLVGVVLDITALDSFTEIGGTRVETAPLGGGTDGTGGNGGALSAPPFLTCWEFMLLISRNITGGALCSLSWPDL